MKPNFFAIIDNQELDAHTLGFPNAVKGTFQIVTFTVQNLENPKTEPIGVFFQNGNRTYLWRDKYWAEYDLPTAQFLEALDIRMRVIDAQADEDGIDYRQKSAYQKAYNLIQIHRWSLGPTDKDHIDNPQSHGKIYRRVLYEISG